MPAKTSQVPNLTRSASAPEISATVMIANVAWNATPTSAGTPDPARMLWSSVSPLSPRNSNGWPKKPPTSVPKDIE